MTQERLGQFTIDSSDNSEFYLEVSEHDDREVSLGPSRPLQTQNRLSPRADDINQIGLGTDGGDHFVMHAVDTAFKEHRFTVTQIQPLATSERKLSENVKPTSPLVNPH